MRRLFKQYNLKSTDILRLAVAVLIIKVTISIVSNYVDYLPANFQSDFLIGRSAYFYGGYSIAFYTHLLAGPLSLLLGLLLMSHRFRRRYAKWHGRLGRVQVVVVLFVSVSGLFMARRAASGTVARTGFAALSIMTATSAVLGFHFAINGQFQKHARWMSRCFLCLSSAVVLRLLAGLSVVTHVGEGWAYPVSAWASWLMPLIVYDFYRVRHSADWETTTVRR